MNTGDMDRLHEELIAYLEGELAPEARTRVEREISQSPDACAELNWIRSVIGDLETIEREGQPEVPNIDIVDSVMQAVRKANAPASIEPLKSRPRRVLIWWAVAAAAAVLLVAGYFALRDGPRTKLPPPIAKDTTGEPGATGTKPAAPTAPVTAQDGSLPDIPRNTPAPGKTDAGAPLESTAGPRIELALSDVLAIRPSASEKGATMDKLLGWASLARKALDNRNIDGIDPMVVLGAAEHLTGESQRQALLTVVGKLENDPNSKFQLARNYLDTPAATPEAAADNEAKAVAQLADVKSIDPDNALPYYFDAKAQLDAGDTEGALASLIAAKSLNKASAYSLDSALAEAEALNAAGMKPDVARMVAALTAGVDENNFLCQLASDLLRYGQGFLSANDSTTAEAIFKGVEQLGRQVEAGASLSQEELAGLDIQRYALDGLGQLYTTVESAEGMTSVTQSTNALTIQVQNLAGFFNALDELFLKPMTTDFWNMVSGAILGSGDLALFHNPEVSSAVPPAARQ